MRTIAIVGAGFGGTMTCVHLMRALAQQGTQARIVSIERSGRFTAGVAYSTSSPSHLLNVPAGRMSAFPDDADHFLRWAKQQDPRIGGGTFVPRQLYGRYLAALLADTETAARPTVQLTRVPRAAAALRMGEHGVDIELDGGSVIQADLAVLAIGNFPPGNPAIADPSWYGSWRYAKDPWAPGALEVEPDGDVLLLGTGLTMIDIAVALKEKGHRGVVHAISRRGLLPQPHRVSMLPPPPHARPGALDEWPRTARGLLRALRAEIRTAAAKGIDWREVVTSLRHDTPALWRSLAEIERERFLRHLRPYWETHRHRAAPEAATTIAELVARTELVIHAGRVLSFHEDTTGVDVRIAVRGAGERTIRVARVVNCTGPETDLRRVDDPFVRRLVADGLVRPDALGLGLDTRPDGAIVGDDGRVTERLWLVGPLRKGQLWENTAVPELRAEARAMALRLVAG